MTSALKGFRMSREVSENLGAEHNFILFEGLPRSCVRILSKWCAGNSRPTKRPDQKREDTESHRAYCKDKIIYWRGIAEQQQLKSCWVYWSR